MLRSSAKLVLRKTCFVLLSGKVWKNRESHLHGTKQAHPKMAVKADGQHTCNTLFVRNLPFTTTDSELESIFGDVGPIRRCFVVKDKGEYSHKTPFFNVCVRLWNFHRGKNFLVLGPKPKISCPCGNFWVEFSITDSPVICFLEVGRLKILELEQIYQNRTDCSRLSLCIAWPVVLRW